jgi:hypothetical protein
LVDYLHAFTASRKAPPSLGDFLLEIPVPNDPSGSVRLLPAGRAPTADYWRKLSELDWHQFFYSAGARGVPFFLELKERIRKELNPDFLLIDSRTGITELGGVAMSILPDKLVCLLLNNRENLEGARAVLRSVHRSARLSERTLEIVPVLTRIPLLEHRHAEAEIVRRVQAFLNEKADRLEDTLQISDLFVLHSEPALELAERLHVGSETAVAESHLLRDYLRLFVRVTPELIQRHIGALIGRARDALYDDPDGAQRELENLAEYVGHPEVYRALLKLYRVRNVSGSVVVRTAERLWNLTHEPRDPLVQEAVEKDFAEAVLVKESRDPAATLRFVEEVWKANGAKNATVGLALAKWYSSLKQAQAAGDVLLELARQVPADKKVLTECLRQLRSTERWDDMAEVIKPNRSLVLSSPELQLECAYYYLRSAETDIPSQLTTNPVIGRIARSDADLAYALLLKAGQTVEAQAFKNLHLKALSE